MALLNQTINIDINSCETILCPKCQQAQFIEVFILKKISILQSPTGREEIVPVKIFTCRNCNAPLLG